jgi:hypothetical protein
MFFHRGSFGHFDDIELCLKSESFVHRFRLKKISKSDPNNSRILNIHDVREKGIGCTDVMIILRAQNLRSSRSGIIIVQPGADVPGRVVAVYSEVGAVTTG